jgi:hypothetical protein
MSIEEYQAHQEWFIDVSINGKNWLLSLGPRRGLNVGRIIALGASSPESLKTLLNLSETIIKNSVAYTPPI